MPHTLAGPVPSPQTAADRFDRLALLIGDLSSHVHDRLHDGALWQRWRAADPRLGCFKDLGHVVEAWQGRTDESVRDALAALTALGSVRGSDDELAAMTALVLIAGGVCRMAHDLAGLCEPEDVVVAMWLEIRRAEPTVGPSVARHLIKRVRQRVIRESQTARSLRTVSINREDLAPALAGDPAESEASPVAELVDLLMWAERCGVMGVEDVALVAELVDEERAGASRTEALRRLGARRGLAERTVRRHLQQAIEALRSAAPDYLAATA